MLSLQYASLLCALHGSITAFAANSTSCDKHGDCNECVGTFSTSSSCLWCSSSGKCISDDDADQECPSGDQESSCDTPYYTIIFILVLGFLVCVCMVSCFFREWNRHRNNGGSLRTPLLGRSRSEVLRDSESSDDWMCVICGFDNGKNKEHCTMCGTTQNFTSEYRIQKIKQQEKKLNSKKKNIPIPDDAQLGQNTGHSVNALTSRNSLTTIERLEAFNYRRLNQLSIRQKSARRRKMWQRVVDESSGQLRWTRTAFKDPSSLSSNSKSSFFSSFRQSETSVGSNQSAKALLAAASGNITPTKRYVKKDSFDATLVSTSPGFVSHFTQEGKLDWERVETGGTAGATTSISAPHYSGAVSDPTVLQISG
jgi:hypothetical protein